MARPDDKGPIRVGVLSDTHGTLTDSAQKALTGVHHIVHAGDVGSSRVLEVLSRIAPVAAVRGNMDGGSWASSLPPMEIVEMGEATFCIVHDLVDLDLDPAAAGFHVVVHGHTHESSRKYHDGVLYLNPGSASLPRRGAEPSVAVLEVRGRQVTVHFRRI
ncbi:MAG: YfcE family phosphodiesterase [Desulfobacteraceae bacterium]|nr:YfcE family phosphodiesterase [Desulfobacteraceae bacterium]